jgi:hypothetical protein
MTSFMKPQCFHDLSACEGGQVMYNFLYIITIICWFMQEAPSCFVCLHCFICIPQARVVGGPWVQTHVFIAPRTHDR